ncbi:RNA-binding protein YhbY [hydrothermal vent metagenome]|uniref:RNA-binding protein YhbY n=1 Tax=hydrothermal vent metagenome TaxID=652676 RepID=A0A3B1AJF7_9ZZZZ
MPLNKNQRNHLRKLAHPLKPVVIIGQAGLTENIITEIGSSLEHHELIKVRLNATDKASRQEMIDTILEQSSAELVQAIGHICAIYRRAEKPRLELPKK